MLEIVIEFALIFIKVLANKQPGCSCDTESVYLLCNAGHNNPIGGSALSILFQKLSRLLRYTSCYLWM